MLNRNERSHWSGNGVHVESELVFMIGRNMQPIDLVKQTGHIVLSDRLNLEHNIKANLHTFDNRDEVSAFIEASFNNNLFDDIATAFEEITNKEG